MHTTSHYLRLEKNDYIYRLPPKKVYHGYIARINSTTYHYAHARQTQVNWKNETKKPIEHLGTLNSRIIDADHMAFEGCQQNIRIGKGIEDAAISRKKRK